MLSKRSKDILTIGIADRKAGTEIATAIDDAGVGLVSLVQTVTNGDTTHAPSGAAVNTALGGKQATITMNAATTGTGATVGQVAVAGLTVNGKVIVTALADPGANLVISHVTCGAGFFTVYTKDVTGVPTVAALDSIKVAYLIISL